MLYVLFFSALLLATSAAAHGPIHSRLNQYMTPSIPSPATTTTTAPTPKCGIDQYDFSSLMDDDWAGLADDYSMLYYINLCHTVQNLWCTLNPSTSSVQVCQVSPNDPQYTYNLMSNDTAATNWSYINGKDATDGVQFQSQTGEGGGGCPNGGNRITVGKLVCGNSSSVVTGIMEGPACTYTMTLPNTLVCSKGQAMDTYATEVAQVRQAMAGRAQAMAENGARPKALSDAPKA